CGFYAIGKFVGKLLLNRAERVTDTWREVFSLHEVRHRFQRRIGLDYGGGGNIPERERVVLYWMNEADARLTGILYAFEKAERGDKSQLQAVADDQTMINAFYKTLNQDRTNVPEAARMAMLAFLEQKSFLADYANSTLDWIDQARKAYDPEQPATTLLSREKLMKMGEIGYGNYMTDAVIDAFDQAFSPENYQSLKTARANKGGRVCRL
ncbi:MAG: hypothetical protein JWO78_1923, partial [Micavibrio sp.]|nr:hypothetical protein [Micavibrio sp.]